MVNASSSRLKLQKISAKAKLVAQASFYIQIHLEWSIALWAWDASHHGRVLPKQICHGVRPVAKHFSRYAHRIQPHQHPLLYHLATLPSTALALMRRMIPKPWVSLLLWERVAVRVMVNASSSRLKLQKISAKAKLVAQASFYIQTHLEWSIALWAWDASPHGRVLPKQICHGVR